MLMKMKNVKYFELPATDVFPIAKKKFSKIMYVSALEEYYFFRQVRVFEKSYSISYNFSVIGCVVFNKAQVKARFNV